MDHDNDDATPAQFFLQVRVKPISLPDNGVTEDRPMIVFNHEDEDANAYTVELTAIDATGDRDLDATLTVNIVVTDRNEAPSSPSAVPEGLRITGDDTVSYPEGNMGMVASYEIAGPGAGDATATWTLSGDDRGDLSIGRTDGVLTFNAVPDFENPKDMNPADNTYEITVSAAIAGGDTLMLPVMVMVTNVDELGTVTVSPPQPVVGSAVTVTTPSDEDGGVTGETWRWASAGRCGRPIRPHPRGYGCVLHPSGRGRGKIPARHG